MRLVVVSKFTTSELRAACERGGLAAVVDQFERGQFSVIACRDKAVVGGRAATIETIEAMLEREGCPGAKLATEEKITFLRMSMQVRGYQKDRWKP